MGSNKLFVVTATPEAAALITATGEQPELRSDGWRHSQMIFPNTPEIRRALDLFRRWELQCDARSLLHAYRSLIADLRNASGRGAE